jgi:hypothetical protein
MIINKKYADYQKIKLKIINFYYPTKHMEKKEIYLNYQVMNYQKIIY